MIWPENICTNLKKYHRYMHPNHPGEAGQLATKVCPEEVAWQDLKAAERVGMKCS
jgi:hypothetical protein